MKKSFYILIAFLVILLGYGFYLEQSHTTDYVLNEYITSVQNQLQKDYQKAKADLSSKAFRASFSKTKKADFTKFYSQPYSLLAYKNNKLVKWYNNKLFLTDEDFNKIPRKGAYEGFAHLSNAYSYIVKQDFPSSIGDTLIGIAIIPIKYAYQIDKLQSSNYFRASNEIPTNVSISDTKNKHAVVGPNGEKIYLLAGEGFKDTNTQIQLIYIFGLAFLIFLGIANQIANKLSEHNSTHATIFLLSLVTIVSSLLHFFDPSSKLGGLGKLAETLKIPVLHSSLVVVLFYTISFLWLMVYLNKAYVFKKSINLKGWQKFIVSVVLNAALMVGIIVVLEIYSQIIIFSEIHINFLTLLQHRLSSILGLAVMLMSLSALVLFALWMIKFISQLKLTRVERALCVATAFAIITTILYFTHSQYSTSILYGSSILLPFALDFYISDRPKREPYEIYIWFGLMALFSSFALYFFQNKREINEMQEYAQIISEERDTTAEKEVLSIISTITKDPKWDEVFSPAPFFFKMDKAQLLILGHLEKSKYLTNNYSFNFFLFADLATTEYKDQGLFEGQSLPEYKNKLLDASLIYPYDNVYLYNTPDGSYIYYVEKEVITEGKTNLLVLQVKSEILGNPNINSPIFSSHDELVRLKNISNYDYAMFKENRCIRKKGKIENQYYSLNAIPEKGKGFITEERAHINYIYTAPNGNVVMIRKKAEGTMQFLSLFSMLFFLISVLAIFINLTDKIIKFIPDGLHIKLLPGNTFYAKIQSGFLILIYITFIFIGFVTAVHFNNSNKLYHDGRLTRKSNAIHRDINFSLYDIPKNADLIDIRRKIEESVDALSEIHRMNSINFFDIEGNLLQSSKKEIYLKGVAPERMDPKVLDYFSDRKSNKRTQEEQIGDLKFKSAYFPIYHAKRLIGYFGIPYYTKEQARLNDLNDFVSSLLVAYISLFIIALSFIVYGSRILAGPIKDLSKAIGSGKEIEWDTDDEFKEFVKIYNESLRTKEIRHQLRVQVEKESAWRDMAKQVAHDIKNPLTPIKLHIQHLQRSIKDRKMDMDQIEQRTDKVTKVILSQIDSLLGKVDSFKDIANINEAARENVLINQLLADIALLHEKEVGIDIFLKLPEEKVFVHGNKGKLERVFSNLVKNAVQAIPDSRHGVIVIELLVKNNLAIINVKDNGSGIPDTMTEKVFTPNFTTKSSGTGLGLHICKSIIEAHQGHIDFSTERDKGTTFSVELKTSRVMNELYQS